MASSKQSHANLLLLACSTLSVIIISSNAADCVGSGAIAVYWGQEPDDATKNSLKATCDSGNYNIVILESLVVYDDGRKPTLDLRYHCGTDMRPCSELEGEIKHCQDLDIKVFLNIGLFGYIPATPNPTRDDGHSNLASLSSSDDANVAKDLADYLLENILNGNPGPLGNVSLDGIDITNFMKDGKNLHWDVLVKAINESTNGKKIYISAAPQYVYPDPYLEAEIKNGLLDYIWVEFFDLEYSPPTSVATLLKQWETKTSQFPTSTIFLGIHAIKDRVGYIPPDVLKSDVLPTAKKAPNYGGVMIYNRYHDRINDYSEQIKESVPKSRTCVSDDEPASITFYSRSFPM